MSKNLYKLSLSLLLININSASTFVAHKDFISDFCDSGIALAKQAINKVPVLNKIKQTIDSQPILKSIQDKAFSLLSNVPKFAVQVTGYENVVNVLTDATQAAISLQNFLNENMNEATVSTCTKPTSNLLEKALDPQILKQIYPYTDYINAQMDATAAKAQKNGKQHNVMLNKVAWHGYCVTKTLFQWYATTPVARTVFSTLLSGHIDTLLANFNKCMPDPRNIEDINDFSVLQAGLETLKGTLFGFDE